MICDIFHNEFLPPVSLHVAKQLLGCVLIDLTLLS